MCYEVILDLTTCLHRLDDMMGLSGAGFGPTPGNMNSVYHTELSSLEETCSQFDGGTEPIKVGVDMHQDFYVVVCQVGGGNPKPPQRFQKEAFLHWAANRRQTLPCLPTLPIITFLFKVKVTDGFNDELSRAFTAFASGAVCLTAFGKNRQYPCDGTSGRCRSRFSFAVRRTNRSHRAGISHRSEHVP